MIEQTIVANTEAVTAQTAALEKLIEILANGKSIAPATTETKSKSAKSKTSGESTTAQSDVKDTSGTTTPSDLANSTDAKTDAKTEVSETKLSKKEAAIENEITLEQIRAAATVLVSKDRAKLAAILESFGVKRASELQPEQLADAYAKMTATDESNDLV